MPGTLLVLRPLQFVFEARDRISFDDLPGQPIRGALGEALRRQSCRQGCPGPGTQSGQPKCPWRAQCLYGRLFDPEIQSGPSGFHYPPRPFVLRVHTLRGRTFLPGDRFAMGLNWFATQEETFPAQLVRAMALAGRAGWNGQRARLVAVDQLGSSGAASFHLYKPFCAARVMPAPLTLSDSVPIGPVRHVRIEFVSPTCLIHEQAPATEPLFSILLARIRDRLSGLATFWNRAPLTIDFKGLAERAQGVRLTVNHTHWVPMERPSRRSGKRHPLSGFVGEAIYEGDLRPFVPFLRAACWSGVGKNTPWGQGVIRLRS